MKENTPNRRITLPNGIEGDINSLSKDPRSVDGVIAAYDRVYQNMGINEEIKKDIFDRMQDDLSQLHSQINPGENVPSLSKRESKIIKSAKDRYALILSTADEAYKGAKTKDTGMPNEGIVFQANPNSMK